MKTLKRATKPRACWQPHLGPIVMLMMSAPVCAQLCREGHLKGAVHDADGAAIVGALVKSGYGEAVETNPQGEFTLPCGAMKTSELTVSAQNFETTLVTYQRSDRELIVVLPVAPLYSTVRVAGDEAAPQAGGSGYSLSAADLQRLADDPDDFRKQLQVLATTAGGAPGQATIALDGFQNAGSLPPKSTIALVRIAPDMFSSEYASPPYMGGRVDIVTKPGLNTLHGALFFTNSDSSFNATNPLSVSATPAGKKRYGFELSGPLIRNRLDAVLALEKRDITEFSEVNALVLGNTGGQQPLRQTVEAPQQLWIGSARGDLQLTPNDTLTSSYIATVNNSQNQGIGGLVLPEAGFNLGVAEYDLRFTNTQTLGSTALHQSRIGLSWKATEQVPLSTAVGLTVEGFFQSGGSTALNKRLSDRDLEINDMVEVERGRHEVHLGVQALAFFVRNRVPDTFNGSYRFGGGSAPALDASGLATASGTTINALEQYRRALLGLAGGTPTVFAVTQGNAEVNFTQWQTAAYVQDTVKLQHRLSISGGLRYAAQTSPNSLANLSPRVGLSWSPDRRNGWVLHARAGLFSSPIDPVITGEAYRFNGDRQTEYLIYSPTYLQPLVLGANSLDISSTKQFSSHPAQAHSLEAQLGVEHDLPRHWNVQASYFYASGWNGFRSVNINAPELGSTSDAVPDPLAALSAPRPLGANQNILQYSNTDHVRGNIVFAGLNQHSYRRFGLFLGYLHMGLQADAGEANIMPQSSYSNAGEWARPDWQATHRVFLVGNVSLPMKVELATESDASSGTPYNLTVGTDNNGDGNFNDRPSFAHVQEPGVYGTRFGLLSVNTVNGTVPRNLGTLPWVVHVSMNLSRTFRLHDKSPSSPAITLNARAANLLNHENVTAVGTVISSSTFSQPLEAESARRGELGIRFTF